MRCCLAVLLAGSALAAPVPKELKKIDDKVAIVGTWVLASANVNGADVARYDPDHSVKFSADGRSSFLYGKGGSEEPYDKFVVDTAASPRTVTWLKDTTTAINPRPYEFRGDKLVMATRAGGGKEPTSLEPGPGVIVFVYERAEKK
jgi:uncharacterized protein (TIGR03067 family)